MSLAAPESESRVKRPTSFRPKTTHSKTSDRFLNNQTRKKSASTAEIYDWNIKTHCTSQIHSGQHNAFPRRLPSASSERLRQMYLNTDTVRGRLVFNTTSELNRQKRLTLLQKTLEEQTRQLEERNRKENEGQVWQQQHRCQHAPLSRPHTTSQKSRRQPQLVPPIKSWKGLTVIRESKRLHLKEREEINPSDFPKHLQTEEKVSAEMSIYLPRADVHADSQTICEDFQSIYEVATTNVLQATEVASPRRLHPTKLTALKSSKSLPKKISKSGKSSQPLSVAEKSGRPLTAYW